MTLTRLFKTAAMLGLPLILSGCIVGMRFYSSDPRPPKDVALIYAAACSLDAVTPEGRPKMNLVGTNGAISEVLPGKYVLDLRYVNQGAFSTSTGDTAPCVLQAEAGHVYYFYPEFPAPKVWRPAFVDVANDEDYKKIPRRDPATVKKWIAKYWASPRPAVKKEEIQTKDGTLTIWR